jgi:3-oxoacyl-(acyl-carrier-protein) synthase
VQQELLKQSLRFSFNGIVPPTINHSVVDENIDPTLNLTLNKAERDVKVAMSNTFGFEGIMPVCFQKI